MIRRASPAKRPGANSSAAARPRTKGAPSAVVTRVISQLDAAAADRTHGPEVIEAVRLWLAKHHGTSRSPSRSAAHETSTLSANGGPRDRLHRQPSLAASTGALPPSHDHGGHGATAPGQQQQASPSVVSSSWVRLFAAQATGAMRTLSSLTSLARIRIECLSNLQDLADQASSELANATMHPEHAFVRSALSLVPLVAYQLKAGSLQTTKPALRVISGIAKTLGSYLAPASTTTLRSLLEAWAMPQHVTVQQDIYEVIEAVAGTATDAAPVIQALVAFFELQPQATAGGKENNAASLAPTARLPGFAEQRKAAARLVMQLLAATVHTHTSIMRLRAVVHGHRVSEEVIMAPFGTPVHAIRAAVATAPAAGLGVEPEDVSLVGALEPIGKAAMAVDVADAEGGLLLTLAAHPFTAGDSALPTRPPSPGHEPADSLLVSRHSLSDLKRVRGPPVLTIQEPTPKRADGPDAMPPVPADADPEASGPFSPKRLESTMRGSSADASPPMVTETPRPSLATAAVSPPTPPDPELDERQFSPDARSPHAAAGAVEAGSGHDLTHAFDGAAALAIEGRLSVSVTSVWRMFLAALTPAEQEQIFPCLYVLFPGDITEMFNAATVPAAPSDVPEPSPPAPLTAARRLALWRAMTQRAAAPVVVTTPLVEGLALPTPAGPLHFLVPKGHGGAGSAASGRRSVQSHRRRAGSVVSYTAPASGGALRSPRGGGSRPPSPAAVHVDVPMSPLNASGAGAPSTAQNSFVGRPPLAPSAMASPVDSPAESREVSKQRTGSGSALRPVQLSQITRRRSRTAVSADMQDVVGDGAFVRDEWREQDVVSPIPLNRPLSRIQSTTSLTDGGSFVRPPSTPGGASPLGRSAHGSAVLAKP